MAKISIFLSTNVVSLIHFPLFLTYISFFVPNKNIDFCRETEDKNPVSSQEIKWTLCVVMDIQLALERKTAIRGAGPLPTTQDSGKPTLNFCSH